MDRIFKKLERYFGAWMIGIMNPDQGLWSIEPSMDRVGYLKAMNAKGYHIFMKPENEGRFLLLDDIPGQSVEVSKGPWTLSVRTSGG